MRGWIAVGALLGGALVAAGSLAWAGARSGPAAAIEATLAREGADGIVLLGNSKVSTDLDLPALRAALGPDAPTIAPANVYGTSAPVWYAVLKNRVYANGYHPKLLVIFAPLETALTTDLPAEGARAVLGAQLGQDEPVVSEKVFGGVLDADVRERLRRLLLPACSPDRPEKGPPGSAPTPTNAELRPERSFLADILALAAEHGTPVLFVRAPFGPSRAVQDDVAPELVAATVALLKARGAGWIDLSRGAPEAVFGDGVHMGAAGRRHMTAALAEALRPVVAGGPLPMAPLPPPARLGVTREGAPPAATPLTVTPGEGCARVATHPLLATLGATPLTAAGFGAISPLVPRQGRAALRLAATPPGDCTGMYTPRGDTLQIAAYTGHGEVFELLPSAELPLRGPMGEEAWWVYPGTTLRIALPPLAAGAAVEVVTTGFGGTGAPTVQLGGGAATRAGALTPPTAPPSATPSATATATTLHATGGEAEITLASPPDGPWLLVQRVRVGGAADGPVDVLGGDDPLHVDLLAGAVTYAAPPATLPPMPAGKPSPDGTSLRVDLPPGLPDDEAVFVAAGRGRCAPLEVLRDGAPVTDLDALPTSRGLLLTSRDCAPIGARAEGLSWRLDPERACRGREGPRWLYPGDALTLATPLKAPLASASSRAPKRTLRLDLGGGVLGPDDPAATVTVDVRVDGAKWATETVKRGAFAEGPVAIALPPRRLPEGAEVEVRVVASPGSTWLVLTSAILTESTANEGWAPR